MTVEKWRIELLPECHRYGLYEIQGLGFAREQVEHSRKQIRILFILVRGISLTKMMVVVSPTNISNIIINNSLYSQSTYHSQNGFTSLYALFTIPLGDRY